MGKALRKRLAKLDARKKAFKGQVAGKKGNSAVKEPGSMNLHKPPQ